MYDAFNNKTSVKDTKGNSVSYVFNEDNRLSQVKYDNTVVDYRYTQDVFGNQQTSSSSEGTQTYHYNKRNQIKTIDTDKGIIAYTYDKNGNVSEKKNENGSVDEYTYNDFNQSEILT